MAPAPTAQELAGLAKTVFNNVTAYHLSAGKSLPEFLQEAKKTNKSLRYDETFRRRLELIQDFEFHSASTSIDISPDETYILASGCYPPEIRVYDTRELGLKFARRIDGEVLQARFLSEDFRKIGILRADRTLEFHAQYGRHHEMRMPHFGRQFEYDRATCMMYVGCSSREVVRVDLEEGIFCSPLIVGEKFTSVDALALAPCALPLLLLGGDGGAVECWDTREDSRPAGVLSVSEKVTRLAFAPDGMEIAVGLETGVVRCFDIRSSRALAEYDHRNDFPIVGLEYHSGGLLGTADKKGIKIWNRSAQIDKIKTSLVTSIEAKRPLNDLKFWPGNSGLLFTPVEDTRIGAHFVPSMGPAPTWCSYLDGLTDELEDAPADSSVNSYFEDYVFVSRDQLSQLGGDTLIGSSLVKAYLHGFWMDQRLYRKLSANTGDAFELEKFKAEKIVQDIDAQRPMRVPVRKSVGVNRKLADDLRKKSEHGNRKSGREAATNILEDKRFGKLWNNPDFEIEQA